MLEYDPVADLRCFPMPMGKYGLNPHSEPLYRIVFAPSRRYLCSGEWPDGTNGARWTPLYRNLGEIWVMEKWVAPEQFHKPGREDWNLYQAERLGPWPARGEYMICHSFSDCDPVNANIDKLISWITAGERFTNEDRLQHAREDAKKQKIASSKTLEDAIRSKLPAFGCRPMFAGNGKGRTIRGTKNSKEIPIRYSANELGLPLKPGTSTRVRKVA